MCLKAFLFFLYRKRCKYMQIKCVMQNNICTEVLKPCEEYEQGKNLCKSLDPGDSTTKRCLLYNGVCKAHYKNCGDFITGVDEIKCEANIPLNSLHKCSWDNENSVCKEIPRTCKEFEFELCTSGDISLSLTTSSPYKICLPSFNGFGCKEQFPNCEIYNQLTPASDKNQFDCETIRIINIASKTLDPTSKCVFKEGNCTTMKKECIDFTNTTCEKYVPNNSNKKCAVINDKCEEQFKTCELYDKESTKTKEICESILPYKTDSNTLDVYSKCVFNNNKCERREKTCSKITEKNICINHILTNNNKMCVYENEECKEVYKSCDSYNNIQNKNETVCKKIKIYYSP